MGLFKGKPEAIGQLEITARTARNLSQKVLVGKQSPFVQFDLNSVIKQTVCDKRGGRNPQWSETITFPIDKECHNLTVKVYNKKSKVQSDYIGETVVDILPILKEREKDAWFTIKDRDEYAGDIYIEFTYYPKGVPRDEVQKPSVQPINEIEEGLSILQLKNIRQDPGLNSAELPLDRTISKNNTTKTKHLSLPEQNGVLRKNTNGSEMSLNSLNLSQDNTPILANETDLHNILDEIRSLVDYPYQLPAQEVPPGPGALPPMRRKPLPKPPNSNRSSNSQLQTPNFNYQELIHPSPALNQNEVNYNNILNNNVSNNQLVVNNEHSVPNNYLAVNNEYTVAHLYQTTPNRTPSPAPSSMISDLILGDSVNHQRYLALTRGTTLTRRGSVDSISTLSTQNKDKNEEEYLDYDPTTEVKAIHNRTPSIKRRPIEAPSVLQTNQNYFHRMPYIEDVRGRPLHYYNHSSDNQHFPRPHQHNAFPPQMRPRPYYPPPLMDYPPQRHIHAPVPNQAYFVRPRPMFYSPRALPPPPISPINHQNVVSPAQYYRPLPNPSPMVQPIPGRRRSSLIE